MPVVIGAGGRVPPSAVIEDDAAGDVEAGATFDPASDGLDFYESLEGMLVQVNNPVAVGPSFTLRGGAKETPVVGEGGAGLRTARGGIIVRPSDFNPERMFVVAEAGPMPDLNVGDRFNGPVRGVIDYIAGNYRLYAASLPPVVAGGLSREVAVGPGANQLAVAAFNVENLDPNDDPTKFNSLAAIVVNHLRSPDVLAVEEIQDDNGPVNDAVVGADLTFQRLATAIRAAGGPAYSFAYISPVDDQDGGEPGGNIRVGFLYRVDRGPKFTERPGGGPTTATTVAGGPGGPQLSSSPGRIKPTDPAFNQSRKPLAGEFTYNSHRIFIVANHFSAKGGDQPLFGRFQPPARTSEVRRNQQAQIVHDFVASILAADAQAKVIVLGDLNDFDFSTPLNTLKGTILHNLTETLPANERYTYVFDGNSQALDHILVSGSLRNAVARFDVVHINSEFAVHASDHDPTILILTLPSP